MKNISNLVLLLLCTAFGFSQNGVLKDPQHFYNNRWEASLSKNVSASFRIVSFTSAKPASYSENDTLKIHFYAHDAVAKAKINSSKIIQDNTNYQMLVKNQTWNEGWNVFEPWPTNDVLVKKNIKAKNLGVLIKRKDKIYLPAFITKTSQMPTNTGNNYDVHFFTPANITQLTYKVINIATNEVVSEDALEDIDATSSFKLNLAMENKVAGTYKLVVKIQWISGMKSTKTFRFYHHHTP
ncbi:hypothetical protein [Kordia jejudonensis]|uniref:hypothetical protein n=1 Tax=Kordia jejudonensis TaxID=1348245 RepID=UPI00062996F0|nr:hypothetical protein [Kordia jejudonensis]